MRNDLQNVGPSVERAIPELWNYLHIASFLGLDLACFTRTYTRRSRWGKINFPPILKHTRVKPSLVPRLYPRTRWHLADSVCQTASLADGVWLPDLPDSVCQTPSARWRLTDVVWQAPSDSLADTVWLPDLPDAVSFVSLYVEIGLSTRVKPGNEARLNSCVF